MQGRGRGRRARKPKRQLKRLYKKDCLEDDESLEEHGIQTLGINNRMQADTDPEDNVLLSSIW